jgi:hypothetical protein
MAEIDDSYLERVAAWGLPRLVYAAAHGCEPWDVDDFDGGYGDVRQLLADDEAELLGVLTEAAGLPGESSIADVVAWIQARRGEGQTDG